MLTWQPLTRSFAGCAGSEPRSPVVHGRQWPALVPGQDGHGAGGRDWPPTIAASQQLPSGCRWLLTWHHLAGPHRSSGLEPECPRTGGPLAGPLWRAWTRPSGGLRPQGPPVRSPARAPAAAAIRRCGTPPAASGGPPLRCPSGVCLWGTVRPAPLGALPPSDRHSGHCPDAGWHTAARECAAPYYRC